MNDNNDAYYGEGDRRLSHRNICEDCLAHSGIEVCVRTLKRRVGKLEDGVDGMKKLLVTTLAATVTTLVAVIVALLIEVAKQ